MGIRKLKPTTPGQRHKVIGAFDKITASTPEKSLVVGKKSTGGRNNTGKMTMRHLVSLCCITLTEQRAISSLRTDWKLAKQWFQVAKPLLR